MDGLELHSSGHIEDLGTLSGVDMQLALKGPDAEVLAELLGQPHIISGPFHFDSHLRDAKPGVQVDLEGEAGQGSLVVRGTVRDPLAADGLNLTVEVRGADLAVFGKLTGQELPGGPFELRGTVNHEGGHLKINNFVLGVGRARLAGSSSFPQFPDLAGGRMTAKLSGDDLARFAAALDLPDLPQQPFSAALDLARDNGVDRIELSATVGEDELRLVGPLGQAPDYESSKLDVTVAGPNLGRLSREFNGPALPAAAFDGSATVQRTATGFALTGVNLNAGHLRATGQGTYGPAGQLDLTLSVAGPDLDAFVALISDLELPAQPFKVEGRLKVAGQAVTLDNVVFNTDAGHVALDGHVQLVKGYVGSDLTIDANLEDLQSLLPSGSRFVPRRSRFRAVGRLARQSAGAVTVDSFRVSLGDDSLTVNGALNDAGTANLRVEGEIRNLTELGRYDGRRLPDLPLTLAATLQGGARSASFQALVLRSGTTELRGRGEFALEPRPRLEVTLESDQVDFDALLGTPGKDGENAAAGTKPGDRNGRLIPDATLPMDALRVLDADVDARFGSVRFSGQEARDVSFTMSLEDGRLQVDPLVLGELAGQIRGALVIEPVAAGGRVSLELHADGVQLGWMAAPGQTTETLPKVVFDATVAGEGRTIREVVKSLQGDASAKASAGQISGVVGRRLLGDVFSQVVAAINPFKKDDEDHSELLCSALVLEFADGKAAAEPGIVLSTTEVSMFSHGKIDLDTETIKFDFRSSPKKGVGLSAGTIVNPFIRVGGTLAEPKVVANPTGAVLSGGMAFATTGLSVLVKSAWDRVRDAKDPCAAMLEKVQTMRSSDGQ